MARWKGEEKGKRWKEKEVVIRGGKKGREKGREKERGRERWIGTGEQERGKTGGKGRGEEEVQKSYDTVPFTYYHMQSHLWQWLQWYFDGIQGNFLSLTVLLLTASDNSAFKVIRLCCHAFTWRKIYWLRYFKKNWYAFQNNPFRFLSYPTKN